MFRPPVRRCLPTSRKSSDSAEKAETDGKSAAGAATSERPASSAEKSSETARGKVKKNGKIGRGRSMGVGLGQGGRGGEATGWEEGEPTDFVYTGLFPHEVCSVCASVD